jgi:peptidoglycan/LPS O-acetylase OafA/YrhL
MVTTSQSEGSPATGGFAIRDGHDNFFTPLRLLFASLVVLGHTFVVGNRDMMGEPEVLYHYTFSYLAVNLFFIASGFLVTKSMVYRGDSPSFISARVLRIMPALVVHVFFVMIVIGPLATKAPLGEFFSDPDWYMQPFRVLSFYETNMTMPRIFETNEEQFGSAPLWTLRYEVLAYIGTLGIFSLGFLRKKWMALAQFVLPSLAWILGVYSGLFTELPATIENLCRFGIAYGLGAAIYAYRDRLNFSWVGIITMIAASFLLRETPVLEVIINILMAWVIFRLAYLRMPSMDWMQRIPDLSYGIYIYHWCILQLLFYWMPHLSVIELFALTFPPTVGLAALSWYIVEKPALKSKTAFADWMRKIGLKPRSTPRKLLLD